MFRLLIVLTGCSIIAATGAYYGALQLGTSALTDVRQPENKPEVPVIRKLAPDEPKFADGDAITQQAADHIARDMENYYCTTNCPVEPEVDPLGTTPKTPGGSTVLDGVISDGVTLDGVIPNGQTPPPEEQSPDGIQ